VDYISLIAPESTNYAAATIGSRFRVFLSDSTKTNPYGYEEHFKTGTGWEKVLTGGQSLDNTVTAAAELARIWGSTSANSGIFRGLTVRTRFTVAGTATGDAGRFYNLTNVSIVDMHGIHSTAQLGDEDAASVGTVTGQAAGVRATIGIGKTNTAPAGGTLASLRLDSYFQSTAASAASSYIYACDVSTYGVDAILRLGTLVNRTTSKTTMTAAYAYVSNKMTIGSASAALKVVTPDGSFYIPMLLASDLT
jgi:hypothetical protein